MFPGLISCFNVLKWFCVTRKKRIVTKFKISIYIQIIIECFIFILHTIKILVTLELLGHMHILKIIK